MTIPSASPVAMKLSSKLNDTSRTVPLWPASTLTGAVAAATGGLEQSNTQTRPSSDPLTIHAPTSIMSYVYKYCASTVQYIASAFHLCTRVGVKNDSQRVHIHRVCRWWADRTSCGSRAEACAWARSSAPAWAVAAAANAAASWASSRPPPAASALCRRATSRRPCSPADTAPQRPTIATAALRPLRTHAAERRTSCGTALTWPESPQRCKTYQWKWRHMHP